MKKPSQNQQIKTYLESGKSITDMEALHLFDCRRLASRVRDLRNLGIDIKTDMITIKSGKRIGRYSLVKE